MLKLFVRLKQLKKSVLGSNKGSPHFRILASTTFFFFSLTFSLALSALSEPAHLKLVDVRNAMEEIFSYHVETKELTPLLVRRSFKMFIEQFDPKKIYLTASEVKPFLDLDATQIEKVIDHFYIDQYPEFDAINKAIVLSIQRGRQWRREFYSDFIKKGKALELDPPTHLSSFATDPEVVRDRLRSQLFQIFLTEDRLNEPHFWTTERRQKICALIEKRFLQYEKNYLSSQEEDDHYFSMHILKAMARGLDAHTAFFSHDEAFEMRSSLEKQFEGVGVILREGLDGVEIAALIKGGPAARCGQIQVGDIIVEVNQISLVNASYYDILDQLKGTGQKGVVLSLKRKGAGKSELIIKVHLEREKILIEEERLTCTAEPFADGIIGKLILPSFYESYDTPSCETDIREALKKLKRQGKLLGLVLDMRDNPGGFLSQAVRVTGLFITNGIVTISKYAQGEIQYFRNVDPRVYYTGPIVVLTSKMSASAAEILAQALQDYGVALVIGDERTYGKGTIQYQTVTDLGASSFFKVTVGRYYTVSGKSTQIEGVKADIIVPTVYSLYERIGEKYLEYALKNDQVGPVYLDPLHDISGQHKPWFQKNYLPYLQKKESQWVKMLPQLKANSRHRLENNHNFQIFLKNGKGGDFHGLCDLQMDEAIKIVQDMIILNS